MPTGSRGDGASPAAVGDLSAVLASATDAIATADEAVGRPLTILIPEKYREAHDAGIARVVETGETRLIGRTVEMTGLRRDGSEFPVELSLSIWTEDAGLLRDCHRLSEVASGNSPSSGGPWRRPAWDCC